jgi:hypothetical protein
MKIKPTAKDCNYAKHTGNNPFVKSKIGMYFSDSYGKIVMRPDKAKLKLLKLKELVALTCLACGERWYIPIID